MDFVLKYLNWLANYINWVISYHIKEYIFFGIIFIVIGLLLLIFVRSKILYFFPMVFLLIAAALIIMPVASVTPFEWEYMLVLAFVNLAAGYILYVLVSMVLSRSQL